MNIFSRIVYYFQNFMTWLRTCWRNVAEIIANNELLGEVLFYVSLFIIAAIVINIVIMLFDRF